MSDDKKAVPAIGARLTKTQLNELYDGWCPVCGAGDEYDKAGDELWYCLACPAQFDLTLGRRGGIVSAVRAADSVRS